MIDLFDSLRQLALPKGEFAVFGSGPLAIRNIITEPNDLDVICRGRAWERIRALGGTGCEQEQGLSLITLYDGKLSFGTRWVIGDFDVDELIDNAEMIEGLPFVQLEHVVRYKLDRRSQRDLQHLAALRESGYSICAMSEENQ